MEKFKPQPNLASCTSHGTVLREKDKHKCSLTSKQLQNKSSVSYSSK